jgi:hypothetical protein
MMDEYQSLLTRHQALQAQSSRNPQVVNVDVVRLLIADLYASGRTISDPEVRDGLNEILQYWAEFLRKRTGDRVENTIAPYTYHLGEDVKEPRSRFSLWLMVVGGVVGIIVIAVVVAFTLVGNLRDEIAATEPVIPTEEVAEVFETPEALPVGPTPELEGTVTPVLLPSPTLEGPAATLTLPAPTATAALPTATPATVPSDPADDVVSLGGGQAIASPPQGVDIASCNVTAETLVQASLPAPLDLEGTPEESLTLWLTLQQPLPTDRALNYHFLVALDVDGDPATGRPIGAGYINPELGTEVGAGVFLYPDGTLDPYLFIWDPAQGDWADDARVPAAPAVEIDESGAAVALTFSLPALRDAVADVTGATLNPEGIEGRTGVIASSQTQAAVVDFCPDLP